MVSAALTMTILAIGACTEPPDQRFGRRESGSGGVVLQSRMTEADSMRNEIERLRRDGAERDSALALVRATQELIEGVDRELAAIPGMEERKITLVNGTESPDDADLAHSVMRRIALVKQLAEESDAAIHTLKQQLAGMKSSRDSLRGQNTELRSSLDHFVALAEGLQKDLERANERIAQLEAENRELAQKVITISDTVSALRVRERTVYVAIGTERELAEAGVVRKRGGIRLGPWTPGQTMVPSDDAPISAFRALDMLRDRDIALSSDGAAYRIVSSHSAGTDGNVVHGRLEVRDPERFWRQSRFLILVRQE
jgi:phage shock protein A